MFFFCCTVCRIFSILSMKKSDNSLQNSCVSLAGGSKQEGFMALATSLKSSRGRFRALEMVFAKWSFLALKIALW